MMGKGERGGGDEGWERFFSEPRISFVDDETIADSPLLGQSASGLNVYYDSGRSPLADSKPLFCHFSVFPPLAD